MKEFLDVNELFRRNELVKIAAPMVRYSKIQFRNLIKHYNCDLAFTPMIIADSFCKSIRARHNEFTTNLNDNPVIVQFAANTIHDFVGAAYLAAPYCNGVDLNCGCPQRWAKQMGIGCKLLERPELIYDMTRQCRNRIPQPFTISVKIRLNKNIKSTLEICRQLEHCNVNFITVHARTPDQLTGEIDRNSLKLIRENLTIPVVANGGMKHLSDCYRIQEETGCQGVMVANGLLINPTLFTGTDTTTLDCVQNWVNICYNTTILEDSYRDIDESLIVEKPNNLTFQCFHHHLVFMLEKLLNKKQKRIFNNLQCFRDVFEFLQMNFQIVPKLYDYQAYQNVKILDLDYNNTDRIYNELKPNCVIVNTDDLSIFSDYNTNKNDGKFFNDYVKNDANNDECDWSNLFLEHG